MMVTTHSEYRDRWNRNRWTWLISILAVACTLVPVVQAASSERLQEIFRNLDTDADGQVNAAEFENKKIHVFGLRDTNGDQILQRAEVGLDVDQLQAIDQNSDGPISGLEFVDAPIGRFETYDMDGNGSLRLNEVTSGVEW